MTLFRELLERASRDLDIYQVDPDLEDLRELLSKVLPAAKLDNIAYGPFLRISEVDNNFQIVVNYYSEHCNHVYIPTLIVDSEDPISTAKSWANKVELDMVKDKIKYTERVLKDLYTKLEVLNSCS